MQTFLRCTIEDKKRMEMGDISIGKLQSEFAPWKIFYLISNTLTFNSWLSRDFVLKRLETFLFCPRAKKKFTFIFVCENKKKLIVVKKKSFFSSHFLFIKCIVMRINMNRSIG